MTERTKEEQLAQDKEWQIQFNLLNTDIPDPWHGAKGIKVTYHRLNVKDKVAPF